MPSCPDLAILWWQTDRRITLLLVHVRRVVSSKRIKYTGVCIENCDHMIMTCPGWKVLNALYTPSRAYRLLGSISPWPHVICIRRVTWFPSLRMWLTLGAKHSIFLRSVKNRGVFVTFMQDSSWMLVLYCDLPAFAVEIVLALLALDNELFESSALIGAWLSENILYGAYTVFDTLFPSLLFTLAVFLGLEHEAVSSRHPKYVAYNRY